jgi:hypothetical protein
MLAPKLSRNVCKYSATAVATAALEKRWGSQCAVLQRLNRKRLLSFVPGSVSRTKATTCWKYHAEYGADSDSALNFNVRLMRVGYPSR